MSKKYLECIKGDESFTKGKKYAYERDGGWLEIHYDDTGSNHSVSGEYLLEHFKLGEVSMTHEEILDGRYWEMDDDTYICGKFWNCNPAYFPGKGYFAGFDITGDDKWEPKEVFCKRNWAKIPPEVE